MNNVNSAVQINNKVHSLINKMVKEQYFRIFKVDLDEECKYWDKPEKCALSQCMLSDDNLDESDSVKGYNVDTSLTEEDKKFTQFIPIEYYKNISNNFWMDDPYTNDGASFIDIVNNPETHTGYNGSHIWQSIYSENLSKMDFKTDGDHKNLLYNLISGIQTSVNMHISQDYLYSGSTAFSKNNQIFYDRIGQYPERVKNLFYLYWYLLDVIGDIDTMLPNYTYYANNTKENKRIKEEMIWLSHYIRQAKIPKILNKNNIFGNISIEEFVNQINPTFKNITTLLD